VKPLLFTLDPRLPLYAPLCRGLPAEAGELACRHFPDGETYLRVRSSVAGRQCILLADLSRADARFLPLLFLAATLREFGAHSVGLVAPYLCYMRQDCRFHSGEALTSRIFAERLSRELDWLITVDPHLHRYRSLDEIYRIPNRALSATPALAAWLAARGETPLLVGPDAESRQWVQSIAAHSGLLFAVAHKERRGDRDVSVQLPDLTGHRAQTAGAVIVDDIIASGQTLLQAAQQLRAAGFEHVDCLAVHGLESARARAQLLAGGVRRLVTSNSVPGPDAAIDLSPLLLEPIRAMLTDTNGG